MGFIIAKPSAILAPYIKQYWALESHLPAGKEYLHRIVPSGLMELMFFISRVPEVLDSKKHIADQSIVAGHQLGYYDMRIRNAISLFSVSFEPFGAMMFFNIPLSEFLNQNVSLHCMLQSQTYEVEARLQDAKTFQERVSLINTFLEMQLKNNYKPHQEHRIIESIRQINTSRGSIGIDDLASSVCLSRKQFERSFRQHVGASPKQFLKAVRFQYALYTKQNSPTLNLTELSYTSGYYDQSHMINEFKTLTGYTPRAYFGEYDPQSDYFL